MASDVFLQRRGWTFMAAGYARVVSPSDRMLERYEGVGGEVSGAYMLLRERLSLGVRHSRFAWDRRAPGTREEEWQVGLSVHRRRHDWKSRLYYENHRWERTVGSDSAWLVVAEM